MNEQYVSKHASSSSPETQTQSGSSAEPGRCAPATCYESADYDHFHTQKHHGRFMSSLFFRILLRCLLGIIIAILLLYLYLFITA